MFKRMVAVLTSISLMLAVCGVRIYTIQREGLKAAANSQSTYTLTVCRTRGTIYDCNGHPITNSIKQRVAVLVPTVKTVTSVSQQLDGEVKKDILSSLEANTPCFSAVTNDFVCEDAVLFDTYQSPARIAPHTVGYLDSQKEGVTGIEYAYNSILSGGDVKVSYTVDANCRPLSGTSPVITGSAKWEDSVKLTLDSALCRHTEAVMKQTVKKGAAVIIESKTGKIRGICSVPSFDTEDVAQALKSSDAPLINRVLCNYNVGSVFKICVAAAALKDGIPPTRTYECQGSLKIGDNVFNCHDQKHGRMDMTAALSKSCNCYFIQLAQDIGAESIYNMCVRFGFNRSLTLADSVKAQEGILPSLSAIKTQPASLANFSFGQGELMLSPLHIAVMLATIDNGGAYRTPSLVEGVAQKGIYTAAKDSESVEILSQTDCSIIRQMLSEVVNKGTGVAAKPQNGQAYGKTATAESGYKEDGKIVSQSWFAGCYDGYTIVILCENGVSGGVDCAPVFKNICDYLDS